MTRHGKNFDDEASSPITHIFVVGVGTAAGPCADIVPSEWHVIVSSLRHGRRDVEGEGSSESCRSDSEKDGKRAMHNWQMRERKMRATTSRLQKLVRGLQPGEQRLKYSPLNIEDTLPGDGLTELNAICTTTLGFGC